MRKGDYKKKTIALGLAITLSCSMLPAQGIFAEPVNGDGQEIHITTVDDLKELAKQCTLDSWSVDKYVVLDADLNLADVEFDGIPIFSGTFNGNGHTISGFDQIGDGYESGLFRYIAKSGEVKNLKVSGQILGDEEKECIGVICGVNSGIIRDCSFQGEVTGKDTVGGVAGRNTPTGYITGCKSSGIIYGYYMTGGIVGYNQGIVSDCKNDAHINADSEWVEEDDEMETGLLAGITQDDSDLELYSGVDTGGIAGYSDGTIQNCSNAGVIGYEHTGYNIGGIAGRQSGTVFNCTNKGEIFGRKDVGGIIGQMEPSIEIDEAESLQNAIDELHDRIEKTIDDVHSGKNVMSGDLDLLLAYGDDALDSGKNLASQLSDFAENNIDQLKEMNLRMEYVVDQLPKVSEELTAAGDAFSDLSGKLEQLRKDLEESVGDEEQGVERAYQSLQEQTIRIGETQKELNKISQSKNELSSEQISEVMRQTAYLSRETESLEDAISDLREQLDKLDNAMSSEEVKKDLEEASDDLQQMADAVQNASAEAEQIFRYLSEQPDLKFSSLGEEFRVEREELSDHLQGIDSSLKKLTDHAEDYSELANEDLKAVNNQLSVVFNLLSDNMSGYSNFNVEELYEEVSDEAIDSIEDGRVDSCTNYGTVKGDINIGGISGAMSIDEEDPEDNAAGSLDYEIGRRYILQSVIVSCTNEGYVTAKKDGAGGIVGYMAHGVVTDCMGYGDVESTEGDFAGGICGESRSIIRSSYALCNVSGGKNIGGIAGYADVLKDCCAMVDVDAKAGKKGAIAGQIEETNTESQEDTAKVYHNYFVDDELNGIDSVSYTEMAEPVSYEALLQLEGLPDDFRHLKVVYRIEDQELGTEEVAYGQTLDGLHYPKIPEKSGYYGVWPDCSDEKMSGKRVIQGEYCENVLVVESNPDEDGKPYAYAEQTFTKDTRLNVQKGDQTPPKAVENDTFVLYDVSLENGGIGSEETFALRLFNPYEDAEVWGFRNGVWTKLESKARGNYLQVDMTGEQETFCIVEAKTHLLLLILVIIAAAAAAAALVVAIRKRKKHK